MGRRAGFTLVEILVAIAIVAVLAAILVPVFAAAKEGAHRTVCSTNFRQTHTATTLYSQDYDDYFPVARYTADQRLVAAGLDRTWVQLTLPYIREFSVFTCPADHTRPSLGGTIFDPDLVLGDAWEKYYEASKRANSGFNFVYLSPLIRLEDGSWRALPRNMNDVREPSDTLLFADSAWRISPDGKPEGGGSYLIVPPCRYDRGGLDSFGLNGLGGQFIFTPFVLWEKPGPKAAHFGGLWAWHGDKLTTISVGGNVAPRTIARMTEGCDVRGGWGGSIFDAGKYLWDLR